VADFSTVPRPRNSLGFVRAGESVPTGPKASRAFEEDIAMASPSVTGLITLTDQYLKMESQAPAQKPKGKRAMDAFLEEIKRYVSGGFPTGS
jgi:hypothetical protein